MRWNSLAVDDGDGVIVATKSQLWARSPEKVLGLKKAFAQTNTDLTTALIRSLVEAGAWLDIRANRIDAADVLSRPRYVGTDRTVLERALTDGLQRGAEFTHALPAGTLVFHEQFANFPWPSHAMWILTQMIRWGQVTQPFDVRMVAHQVFRPDIFRKAMADFVGVLPPTDEKSEGSGAFFGDEHFDPRQPLAYLAMLKPRAANVDWRCLVLSAAATPDCHFWKQIFASLHSESAH